MRKALADSLLRLADEDPRLIFLTGDLGFQVFDTFRERFQKRYVNVGVAEAQMVCCASGLARVGWHPLVYSIASFATGRAYEQIRVSLAYPGLPVVVIGAGGGYTYGTSGVTHHAADDLGLMALLPGFTVVAPGDPAELNALLPQMIKLKGPSYLRVGRFGEPSFVAQAPAVLGQARLVKDGERILILTTGNAAVLAAHAIEKLAQEGIHPRFYHLHTVKPLDTATLETALDRVQTIVVVEEHYPQGGLAAAVASWLATQPQRPALVRLGPPDAFALGNWKQESLQDRFAYGADAIAAACRRLTGSRVRAA